jgi:hypothetical protein
MQIKKKNYDTLNDVFDNSNMYFGTCSVLYGTNITFFPTILVLLFFLMFSHNASCHHTLLKNTAKRNKHAAPTPQQKYSAIIASQAW